MARVLKLRKRAGYILAGFLFRRGLILVRPLPSMLCLNLLGGIGRGAGIVIGATMGAALFIYLLSNLTWLPWVGWMLAALAEAIRRSM